MLSAMFSNVYELASAKDGQKEDSLITQINIVKGQQHLVEELFNNSNDEDLTEACIYQSKAFGCYYRYLLKLAREQNCSTQPQLEPARAMRVAGLL